MVYQPPTWELFVQHVERLPEGVTEDIDVDEDRPHRNEDVVPRLGVQPGAIDEFVDSRQLGNISGGDIQALLDQRDVVEVFLDGDSQRRKLEEEVSVLDDFHRRQPGLAQDLSEVVFRREEVQRLVVVEGLQKHLRGHRRTSPGSILSRSILTIND